MVDYLLPMKRKILLIGNTSSRSALRLKEESLHLNIIFDMVSPANIFLQNEELVIHNTSLHSSPLAYDVYFFRGISQSKVRMREIAQFLQRKNKRVIEKMFPVSDLPEDKLVKKSPTDAYMLPEQKIIHSEEITQNTVKFFPVVAKKFSSSMGKGVTKISSITELLTFINHTKEMIVLQKYYPLEFDIRILIIGEKIIGALARYKPQGEEFLTTRHGGNRKAIPVTTAMADAALEAKKLQGLEIAGVDLFFHNNKLYVLEVNASPQFFIFEKVTSKNIAREILTYLNT